MKESQSEASPDLDAGWDELESLSPQAPARRDSEDDLASIFAVDEGWETDRPVAKPAAPMPHRPALKVPVRAEAARPPAPLAVSTTSSALEPSAPRRAPEPPAPRGADPRGLSKTVEPSAPLRVPEARAARGADPRGLSKKQRRELERRGKAHALRTKAERKERAKSERKARREADQQRLAAERARMEAARRAEEEQRKQAPKPPKANKPSSKRSESSPEPKSRVEARPTLTRAQRKLEERLQNKKTGREKSRFAADLSPWLFAIVILVIVAVLAMLRH